MSLVRNRYILQGPKVMNNVTMCVAASKSVCKWAQQQSRPRWHRATSNHVGRQGSSGRNRPYHRTNVEEQTPESWEREVLYTEITQRTIEQHAQTQGNYPSQIWCTWICVIIKLDWYTTVNLIGWLFIPISYKPTGCKHPDKPIAKREYKTLYILNNTRPSAVCVRCKTSIKYSTQMLPQCSFSNARLCERDDRYPIKYSKTIQSPCRMRAQVFVSWSLRIITK